MHGEHHDCNDCSTWMVFIVSCVYYLMIPMPKTEERPVEKARYMCNDCNQEFVGSKCPQCGTVKNLTRLAPNGISQQDHTIKTLFESPEDLKPTEMSEFDLLDRTEAAAAYKALKSNMREAYVARSDITKKEAELQRLKKQVELDEVKAALERGVPVGTAGQQPGRGVDDTGGMSGMGGMGGMGGSGMNMPFFGGMGMNPQAVFMSQLMKMDKEKRSEFLAQLSDADPQALSALSSMLAPASPAPMNMMAMNPGMMANMPPWMMWYMMQQMMQQQSQQPQSHAAQADPTDTAVSIATTIFDLAQKMQPQRDDSIREMLKEFKDEMKAMREKLYGGGSGNADLKPVLDKINNLETQVAAAANNRPSVLDSVTQIQGLVNGLEAIGLVKRSGSEGRTVDDEVKLKQFDHTVEMEKKKMELEEKKIDADKQRADMAKNLFTGIFSRALLKRGDSEIPVKKVAFSTPSSGGGTLRIPAFSPKPVEVIESHDTDGGRVLETRAPVKRSSTEVV